MKLTAREETIQTLLSWWVDVLDGWTENGRGNADLGVKMMSRAYNHPSYRELERCLIALRDEENATYWHLRETYQSPRRTVLACPRCGAVEEIAAKHFVYKQRGGRDVKLKHKHGGEAVFFALKSIPHISAAVNPDIVTAGVRWIAARFRGEPFIPDELLARERAA